MTDWIPESLHELGPFGQHTWLQWIEIVIAVPAALILALFLSRGVIWAVKRVTSRTQATIDDELVAAFSGPLRLLLTVALLRIALPFLALPAASHAWGLQVLLAGLAVVVVWSSLRAVEVVVRRMKRAAWVARRPSSRAVITLFGRIGKVVIVIIAGIMVLSTLGLPVSSLLAGLGIGGIALAFGAQKTVENVFGAIALGVDQPLREGDFVRIEDTVLGTVERIGLRSSQIRTLDRTVVSLPNGKLADMRIETFAPRDRCRLAGTIRLVYGTTPEQLRRVLAGLEAVLRDHPKIWPDDVVVRFSELAHSSIDIEIMAWFLTGDYGEFRKCRQEVLLGFMDVVEREGTSFALPAQTLHIRQATAEK